MDYSCWTYFANDYMAWSKLSACSSGQYSYLLKNLQIKFVCGKIFNIPLSKQKAEINVICIKYSRNPSSSPSSKW